MVSDQHGERDLKSAIRELAAALERGLDDHPTREELKDLAAGDLPEAEREWIEEHLALCRDCARKVGERAEAPTLEPGRRGDLLTDREIEAQWKRFQAAVRPSRRSRMIRALAAVLLIAAVGFVVWTARLNQPPSEPRITDPVDLLSVTTTRGGPGEAGPQKVKVPGWADEVSLRLDLAGIETLPEYRLSIETAGGDRIWARSGVPPGSNGSIGLGIPRSYLAPGAYRIRLLGPQEKEVAVYELLIEP